MAMHRARETFVHDLHDGQPKIFIQFGLAYNDSDKRLRQVIEKFPHYFEVDEKVAR